MPRKAKAKAGAKRREGSPGGQNSTRSRDNSPRAATRSPRSELASSLRKALCNLDTNETGTIRRDDLKSLLSELDGEMTDTRAEQLLKAAEKSTKGGEIDYRTFIDYVIYGELAPEAKTTAVATDLPICEVTGDAALVFDSVPGMASRKLDTMDASRTATALAETQLLGSSLLVPTFLRQMLAPEIKTVLIFGCGGGFDFVHGMLIYPELCRSGKNVVIVSNSFGNPADLKGGTTVFTGPEVRRITSSVKHPADYAPEVHVASFLDNEYPGAAPHMLYACYARNWSQPRFTEFLQQVVDEHAVDAAICIDGGSDSLMVGDEEGLGDPIEDAVSVASLAKLEKLKLQLLLAVGFGCDRFNHVSDAASLRAVAELTASGGYRGCLALEHGGVPLQFYRRCLEHIYARQSFQSVLAGTILSAAEGTYGSESVPEMLRSRLKPGSCFMWPLMGMLWAFDPKAVADRSCICKWIDGVECRHGQSELYTEMERERRQLARKGQLKAVEELPKHADYRNSR